MTKTAPAKIIMIQNIQRQPRSEVVRKPPMNGPITGPMNTLAENCGFYRVSTAMKC